MILPAVPLTATAIEQALDCAYLAALVFIAGYVVVGVTVLVYQLFKPTRLKKLDARLSPRWKGPIQHE